IEKDHNGTSKLVIHGRIEKPVKLDNLGAPADGVKFEFNGKLNDFRVSVLKSVFINFVEFSFDTRTNQKTHLKVKLDIAKQLDTAGLKQVEAAFEFGATAAIDLGVASGEVHIMAGIYFSLQRKENSTDLACVLSGYLRMGGSLSVLGLIKVSVEFNLSFTYDGVRDKAYGRATL